MENVETDLKMKQFDSSRYLYETRIGDQPPDDKEKEQQELINFYLNNLENESVAQESLLFLANNNENYMYHLGKGKFDFLIRYINTDFEKQALYILSKSYCISETYDEAAAYSLFQHFPDPLAVLAFSNYLNCYEEAFDQFYSYFDQPKIYNATKYCMNLLSDGVFEVFDLVQELINYRNSKCYFISFFEHVIDLIPQIEDPERVKQALHLLNSFCKKNNTFCIRLGRNSTFKSLFQICNHKSIIKAFCSILVTFSATVGYPDLFFHQISGFDIFIKSVLETNNTKTIRCLFILLENLMDTVAGVDFLLENNFYELISPYLKNNFNLTLLQHFYDIIFRGISSDENEIVLSLIQYLNWEENVEIFSEFENGCQNYQIAENALKSIVKVLDSVSNPQNVLQTMGITDDSIIIMKEKTNETRLFDLLLDQIDKYWTNNE